MLLPDIRFDLVVFEEASQLPVIKILKVVTKVLRGRGGDSAPAKLILSGDVQQLPPYVSFWLHEQRQTEPSPADHQLESALAYAYHRGRSSVTRLTRQYRMHQDIARLVNSLFYSDEQWSTLHWQSTLGVEWLDTSCLDAQASVRIEQGTRSLANVVEAQVVKRLTSGLESEREILVVTPYRAQRSLLEIADLGPNVSVRTVDGCQGIEADVVIVSFVCLNFSNWSAFVANPRRMNVAVSRARKRLVLVGNFQELKESVRRPVVHRGCPHLCGLVEMFESGEFSMKRLDRI
ncbi:MAG: hypothetical protein FJ276_32955 [Planctomycetes bacterium]|nr:hypothetical protein [Planctomycetota bacterium]